MFIMNRNDFLKRTKPPYPPPQPPTPQKINNNELDLFLSPTKVRAFDILLSLFFFLLKTEKKLY